MTKIPVRWDWNLLSYQQYRVTQPVWQNFRWYGRSAGPSHQPPVACQEEWCNPAERTEEWGQQRGGGGGGRRVKQRRTLAFFQLDMQGGIFHSCCSFTLTFRLGECMTGAGGEGGPRGIFLFVLGGGRRLDRVLMSSLGSWRDSLESGRRHGVFLGFHHADDSLFGARVEGHALLGGRVPAQETRSCWNAPLVLEMTRCS